MLEMVGKDEVPNYTLVTYYLFKSTLTIVGTAVAFKSRESGACRSFNLITRVAHIY